MPTSQLQSIASRVRALLAKTTEAGATEAEALAAAAKARELMDRYSLSLTDAEVASEGTSTTSQGASSPQQFFVWRALAVRIARYCDCEVWASSQTKKVNFFGLASDSQFAGFLLSSLSGFIQRSAVEWSLENVGSHDDFVVGAIERVKERLASMTASRNVTASDGRSLIVIKSAIVTREFEKLGLNLRSYANKRRVIHDNSAQSAGREAGDRASFSRPLSSQGAGRPLMLPGAGAAK